MTLEQLEQSLPNGLHDAMISSFARDLDNETFVIRVAVLVGLPDDPPELRSRYRDAIVTFSGVRLVVAECPEPSSAFLVTGKVSFSIARSEPGTFPLHIKDRLPGGTDYYSLYVLDWESSIHLAASGITCEWS